LLAALLCVACSASSNPGGEAEGAPPPPETSSPDGPSPDSPSPDAPELTPPPPEELLLAELTTVGWDELSGSPVVLLREPESGRVLPIWIGLAEARAISLELHGVVLGRPMTHDLMAELLRTLDAELEAVVVHALREGTYYGLLRLRVSGREEPRWVDTRPSDGLALALRTGAEILVSRQLYDDLPDYRFLAPEAPEQVVRALGLTVVAVDEVWREEMSLPDRPGIVVLAAAGEAERRGLERGDLIVELGGRPAVEPVDLLEAIARTPEGETLSVTYWRAGEETTVELSTSAPRRPPPEKIVA